MKTITIYDYHTEDIDLSEYDSDDEIVLTVPAKRVICDYCNGEGFLGPPPPTPEELEAMDDQYGSDLRAGIHNERCPECKGERVVDVPDTERMTDRQNELFAGHLIELEGIAQEESLHARGIQW